MALNSKNLVKVIETEEVSPSAHPCDIIIAAPSRATSAFTNDIIPQRI